MLYIYVSTQSYIPNDPSLHLFLFFFKHLLLKRNKEVALQLCISLEQNIIYYIEKSFIKPRFKAQPCPIFSKRFVMKLHFAERIKVRTETTSFPLTGDRLLRALFP